MTAPIALTLYWPSDLAHAPQRGHRLHVSWDELVHWTANPVVAATKAESGGYSLAAFRDNVRRLANVESVSALGLDFDEGDAGPTRILEALGRYRTCVYSTHTSTPEAPRSRAIVALSRPVTAAEYGDLWDHVVAHLAHAGIVVDRAARDPSRLWYVPAHKAGSTFDHAHHEGEAIDVDRLLAHAKAHREELERELAEARARIGSTPTLDRVRRYVDTIEGAVSGQGGHRTTFRVACIVAANVTDEGEQLALLEQYNARCRPPWSRRELAHKLADARRRADLRPLASRRAS